VGKEILSVENLKTYFYVEEGVVKAVNGVSFSLKKGEILGVVGESGCGKSVTALSVMRLVPEPGRIVGGKVIFEGTNLLEIEEREMRKIRGKKISMIFQDPLTSLNPVFKVGYQLMESILTHQKVSKEKARKRAEELLHEVGIPNPKENLSRYPHEFSGGMRQRVMIAIALANNPDILIADEPTTALDVTIQAQILELIERLREEHNSSIILITHDMGVIAQISHEIMVMYAGKIMEKGPAQRIFYNSRHPYTWGLLDSVPRLDEGKKRLKSIEGLPPSLLSPPSGCPFHPRCEYAREICKEKEPNFIEVSESHFSFCHFAKELAKEEAKV
jgi:oligopeptide transport system ATP-binding protein